MKTALKNETSKLSYELFGLKLYLSKTLKSLSEALSSRFSIGNSIEYLEAFFLAFTLFLEGG